MDRVDFRKQVKVIVEFEGGKVHSEFVCERCVCTQVNFHNVDQAVPESLGRLYCELNPAQAVERSDRV